MYPDIFSRVVIWTKAHVSCAIDFEELNAQVCDFIHILAKAVFSRVCVSALKWYSRSWCSWVRRLFLVWINCGAQKLVEAFTSYPINGYWPKLIEYPMFDLRLFNCCLYGTAASVFGSLDAFSVTKVIVNRLEAEIRDWIVSRPALRRAIITKILAVPHHIEVAANIDTVCLLVVS